MFNITRMHRRYNRKCINEFYFNFKNFILITEEVVFQWHKIISTMGDFNEVELKQSKQIH